MRLNSEKLVLFQKYRKQNIAYCGTNLLITRFRYYNN